MLCVVSAVAKEEHRGAHMNIVELIVELIGRNGDGHRLLANSNVIDLALFVSGRYVQIHASPRNRRDRCVHGAQAQATQLGRMLSLQK